MAAEIPPSDLFLLLQLASAENSQWPAETENPYNEPVLRPEDVPIIGVYPRSVLDYLDFNLV